MHHKENIVECQLSHDMIFVLLSQPSAKRASVETVPAPAMTSIEKKEESQLAIPWYSRNSYIFTAYHMVLKKFYSSR